MPGLIFNNAWTQYFHLPHWSNTVAAGERLQLAALLLQDDAGGGGTLWSLFTTNKSAVRDYADVNALLTTGRECNRTGYSRQQLWPQNLGNNTADDWGSYEFSDNSGLNLGTGNVSFGATVGTGNVLEGVCIYCSPPTNYGGASGGMTNSLNDAQHHPLYLFQFSVPKSTGDGPVTVEFGSGWQVPAHGQMWRAAEKGVL